MGGEGSTRWEFYPKKRTVEECLTLDSCVLARRLHFSARCHAEEIIISWTRADRNEPLATCRVDVEIPDDLGDAWLTLSYEESDTGRPWHWAIELTTTRPTFGGLRWWFICGLLPHGRSCQRRVQKLYLPPGGRVFGCRICHGLTYRSCQEAHRYDRGTFAALGRWLGLTPEQLRASFG